MAKLYDLAVAVGSFTTQSGEEKKRWKNIGSVLETKDGQQPAPSQHQQQKQDGYAPKQSAGRFDDLSDDIPF